MSDCFTHVWYDTGAILTTDPPQKERRCQMCGRVEIFPMNGCCSWNESLAAVLLGVDTAVRYNALHMRCAICGREFYQLDGVTPAAVAVWVHGELAKLKEALDKPESHDP